MADAERSALEWWRLLVLGLAAAIACCSASMAQGNTGPERISACGVCHGEDGNSRSNNVPSLAGQPAFFLLSQMVYMREGVRDAPGMASLLKDLKDSELAQLANYFSNLPPKASDEAVDPKLARLGAHIAEQRRCGSCHLPNLAGQVQIPRLAKQRIDYMISTLKSYRDNLRRGADTAMSANIAGASDADIKALAHYAASK